MDIMASNPLLIGFLVILLLIISVIAIRKWYLQIQPSGKSSSSDLLSLLSELGHSIGTTPPDLEELAESAFVESARLLEMDFFQVGLFENDRYRTLFWVRDGARVENQEFLLAENVGIYKWIRETGNYLLVNDFDTEASNLPSQPSYPSTDPPKSGIFVPLMVGDAVIGVISIQSRSPRAFDENNLRVLRIIAQSLAGPIALTLLNDEVNFLKIRLVTDEEIASLLLTSEALQSRISSVLGRVLQTFDYISIHYFEVENDGYAQVAQVPPDLAPFKHQQPLLEKTIASRRPQIDLQSIILNPNEIENLTSLSELCYPLLYEDQLLGILQIFQVSERTFSSEQISQIRMVAANLAMAILESQENKLQQEENWITTVLLEVARYAAQPGDTETALQAVLQLTTMLTGTQWAALLVSDSSSEVLRFGPSAGISRQAQLMLGEERFLRSEFERHVKISQNNPAQISLPEGISSLLDANRATALAIPSGNQNPNIFILEGSDLTGRRASLISGIANQISLRLENYRLIEEAAARQSLERELETARSIQESFLPKEIPTPTGWDLGVTWRVARQVGGDFYDFIPLDKGSDSTRWGIVIADVTDKGIPAALFMALCRTLLRSVAINRVDPGSTLTRLNELLFSDTQADLLVSLFYAVWEPESSTLSYANAGHNPPLLFRPYHPAEILAEHGIVLGATLDASYETYSVKLEQGELVVLYTDGVTEASNDDGEMFGLHRLENLVLGMRQWGGQRITDRIAQRVADYCGTLELPDDLTTVVLYHNE
jgi:serine phosphatase RsbU (regulator of sigma subunit)/GAF domain-containing protein